ncbi:MAG: CbiX/SirB N-terminal domain-containing protein [Proteobacteria bacterium]|nr:CbiX/SirB N-terminal domain-containing protein [Pseudomonadota bacterium]
MKALLILAHGSRKKESNDEVYQLAKSLDDLDDSGFDFVLCAFNQFSSPSAEDQIQVLFEKGVKKIIVLPYFIAAGSHVLTDIPELVRKAKENYPEVLFQVSPHFGAFKGVKNLILSELSRG